MKRFMATVLSVIISGFVLFGQAAIARDMPAYLTHWQQIGYDGYLESIEKTAWQACAASIDEAEFSRRDRVKSFLNDPAHAAMLTLLPVFFKTPFVNEAELAAARDMATSLTTFIISKHGLPVFMADGNNLDFRREWLDSIGVTVDAADAWLIDSLSSYKVRPDRRYALSLTNDAFLFHLTANAGYKTAADVAGLIVEAEQAREKLLRFFATHAAASEARIRENTPTLLRIEIGHGRGEPSDQPETSYADPANAKIVLVSPGAFTHEYIHVLLGEQALIPANAWLTEGLATWLQLAVLGQDDPSAGQIEDLYKGLLATSEAVAEPLLACVSIGQATLANPALKAGQQNMLSRSVAEHSGRLLPRRAQDVLKQYRLNRLTYAEATAVANVLIETYGLDRVLAIYMAGQSPQEAFNLTDDALLDVVIESAQDPPERTP